MRKTKNSKGIRLWMVRFKRSQNMHNSRMPWCYVSNKIEISIILKLCRKIKHQLLRDFNACAGIT